MKVLVYTSLFPNHVQPNFGIFIKQRLFHFANQNGCKIKVVAPVPYCPPWPEIKKFRVYTQIERHEIIDNIEVYHPRYTLIPKISMPLHGISMFVGSVYLMTRIYDSFPFDLIDAHYVYPDGFAAVLLGKVFKKPVVVSARGSDINQYSNFTSIRPLLRYTLKRAGKVISVCEALKRTMLALGIDAGKIRVIPNGVDIAQFFIIDQAQARKRLGISPEIKVVLSVGALIERKGYRILIKAFREILNVFTDAVLYIVGDGKLRVDLKKLIASEKLTDHVFLVGEQSQKNLLYWYNAADCFCLASSREGWANVVMESLACGTPVVATNVWGTQEIITSETVGLLSKRESGSISEKLLSVLHRDWHRDIIREHVASRTWRQVAREVEEVFMGVRNVECV